MKNQRHLAQANQDINTLCDFIEEYQALTRISPGYINDPVNAFKQYAIPVKVYPEGWINHLRLSIQEVPA